MRVNEVVVISGTIYKLIQDFSRYWKQLRRVIGFGKKKYTEELNGSELEPTRVCYAITLSVFFVFCYLLVIIAPVY